MVKLPAASRLIGRATTARLRQEGKLVSNRILIQPNDEISFIKKNICQIFVNYHVTSNGERPIEVTAKNLGVTEKEAMLLINFHYENFSLDFLFQALVCLSKVDNEAAKTLARLATAA